MGDDMEENIKAIANIENKYGLVLFRMGLTYLVDVGHRTLDAPYVEESIRQILPEGEANKAKGVTSVMTPEFQCNIVRCAAELSDFSIWTLLNYIKKYVNTST